jgi:ketosteroid isomerase-like protein
MSEAGAVRAMIEQFNAKACEWYATGNVDALSEGFAEDCWQMLPHAEPTIGRAAFREFWRQAVQWGRFEFSLDTQEVVVSGPIAVERGKYTLKVSVRPGAPQGFRSSEDTGNYVVMWRHEADGQWRAVWDAPVSTVPLSPAAPST